MDLPSFQWLWRIAAWSMGLSWLAFVFLATTGIWLRLSRQRRVGRPDWLKLLHFGMGGSLVLLVVLLLAIGIVGTLGHFGSLGHSVHLPIGLAVVGLTLLSGWSATQIGNLTWARSLHIATNMILFTGFVAVSISGWVVVQKYLP